MKREALYAINSISEYHALTNLGKPVHPLVSVFNFKEYTQPNEARPRRMLYNIYVVNIKKNFDGKIKYGQQYYDFDEGVMTFYAPKQVIEIKEMITKIPDGYTLLIHPDFLHGTALGSKIQTYGFFTYASNEALHLSAQEEEIIEGIFENLRTEIHSGTDTHTHDVVLSHIDLLLSYCKRFYDRQFITRKKVSNDIFLRFEEIIAAYFKSRELSPEGLPSVQYFADQLFISPNYLNDLLKNLTGQTTQQHIHNHLIEKAKELLSTTTLSVSEIAYQLGFQFPQSFNKLFKNKTGTTPLEFRQSFN
ncbi:helix-turn-helix transcriptional regulator [Fluviicola sp.]|uniref:helix-turn-helix domain-containing protein n=1 Tax=Fluviicola sp. TaxID=1917219 RepID=UPI0031DD8283